MPLDEMIPDHSVLKPSLPKRKSAAAPAGFSPLESLKTRDGQPISFGSIRFVGSKHLPTKFYRLAADSSLELVARLLIETAKMTPPSSMISVVGNGQPPAEVELVLRRGLAEAIRRTNAWLITSGVNDGVAVQAAAARSLAIKNGVDPSRQICLAVVDWYALRQRNRIRALENGRVLAYDSREARPPPAISRDTAAHFKTTNNELEQSHTHFLFVERTPEQSVSRSQNSSARSLDTRRAPKRGTHVVRWNSEDTAETPVLSASPSRSVVVDEEGQDGQDGLESSKVDSPHGLCSCESEGEVAEVTYKEASWFRSKLQRYFARRDIRGDSLLTPMLLLVVCGDEEALEQVRDALLGYSLSVPVVPCLVLADSGGAASDIARAWEDYSRQRSSSVDHLSLRWLHEPTPLPPPAPAFGKHVERTSTSAVPGAGSMRSEHYIKAADRLLREIVELNVSKSSLGDGGRGNALSIFRMDSFLGESNDDALASMLQDGLLLACPDIYAETLLTISWGEPTIMQQRLQVSASKLRPEQRGKVLQATLLKAEVALLRTMIDLSVEPLVDTEVLFVQQFNRYNLPEYHSHEHEVADPNMIERSMGFVQTRQTFQRVFEKIRQMRLVTKPKRSRPRMSIKQVAQRGRCHAQVVPQDPSKGMDASQPGFARYGSEFAVDHIYHAVVKIQAQYRGLASRGRRPHTHYPQVGPVACLVLSKSVPLYAGHLRARKAAGILLPKWTDLMMWAVLAGRPDMATLLWEKCKHPMLSALMASQACAVLATNPAFSADSAELLDHSHRYENLAIGVLEAVHEPSSALPLLTLVPWLQSSKDDAARPPMLRSAKDASGDAGDEVIPIWSKSPLELAIAEDSPEDTQEACMHFVSHRHSQYVLEQYFVGEFPGSNAKIRQDAGLMAIMIQACLPLIPGTIVEVESVNASPNQPAVIEHLQTHRRSGLLGRVDRLNFTGSLRSVDAKRSDWAVSWREHEAEEYEHDMLPLVQELKKKLQHNAMHDFTDLVDLVADLRSVRFLHFYSVPKVKFAVHFAAHVAYVAFLTYTLILHNEENRSIAFSSWMRSRGQLERISTQEHIFFYWTAATVVGELNELNVHWKVSGTISQGVSRYLVMRQPVNTRARSPSLFPCLSTELSPLRCLPQSNVWNLFDLALATLVAITFALRLLCDNADDAETERFGDGCSDVLLVLPRNLYALILIIAYFRVMPYLRYYQSVGVLTIVLSSMARDIKLFFAILMIISGGYMCAFAVLLPSMMDQPWTHLASTMSIWQPFWGVFGAFDLERMEEEIGYEMPTRAVAPLLLWIYLFGTTIVLVNLLIAQMSDTYNRVTTQGTIRWHFERASLISEFKDTKLPVPAPLNVVWLVLVELPRFLYNSFKGKNTMADSGYKMIPNANDLQMYQRKEIEVARTFLAATKQLAESTTEAKIDALKAQIAALEDAGASRYEKLNGRIEHIISKMESVDGQKK